MASIRYSPRAERDLGDIWRTIAMDSVTAADRLILRIIDKLELAVTQPSMGVAGLSSAPRLDFWSQADTS